MSMILIVWLILLEIFLINGSGFVYPDEMPPINGDLNRRIVAANNQRINRGFLETPLFARASYITRILWWNCIASYHPTALEFITSQRPKIVVPQHIIDEYGTDIPSALCLTYGLGIALSYILDGANDDTYGDVLNSFGLDGSLGTAINEDVLNCGIDDIDCLQKVAETNGYVPQIMASIVGFQLVEFMKNDGWNSEGDLSSDGTECTANCIKYGDTTNYQPKIQNKKTKKRYRKNKKWKYRWQPLKECNEFGFCYDYNHIVPHIGYTADVRLGRDKLESKSSPNPKYDYNQESKLVLQRLKDLASDDEMKMLVEFMDNKLSIRRSIRRFAATAQWSFSEYALYDVGYELAQYEAVVQSWLEKRRHDLVRPTTWIKQNMADDIIETYGGPFEGVKEIKGKDFESYIRLMPHSEYPSASACICKSVQQFVDKYLQQRHAITDSVEITVSFPAGSSLIEPDITPTNDLEITFESMTEFSNICGESRLWGGMHYTSSVSAAQELCDGIGIDSFEYINNLINEQPL